MSERVTYWTPTAPVLRNVFNGHDVSGPFLSGHCSESRESAEAVNTWRDEEYVYEVTVTRHKRTHPRRVLPQHRDERE